MVVDDFGAHAGVGVAGGLHTGAAGDVVGGRQADGGVAGLRQAVDLGELAVQDGEALLQQRLGDRGAAVDRLAERGEVLGADARFGEHHAEHGRDDAGGGDAEVADEVDGRAGGERAHRDDGRARVEVLGGPPQAANVEAGDADQGDVAGAPVDPVETLARQGVTDREETAVREDDTFRQARGAAGVELGNRSVGSRIELRVIDRVLLTPLLQLPERYDRFGWRGRHTRHDLSELVFQEEESGAGVLEDVADLGRGEPPVDGDEHGAALGAGEEDLVVVLGLLAQVGDPVARCESGGLQSAGDAVALAVQIAVRQAAALAEHGEDVGLVLGVEAGGLDEGAQFGVVDPVGRRRQCRRGCLHGQSFGVQGMLTKARVASPSLRPPSASQ